MGRNSMTVSAAEKFTVISSSGQAPWSSLSNLEYGNSGAATSTLSPFLINTGNLFCAIPNFITAIPTGSEFESLKVTFSDKMDSSYSAEGYCWLTGGTVLSSGTIGTSYAARSKDGDASFWGLAGTPQSIFSGLKSGSIKFSFQALGGIYSAGDVYVKDVVATLTYKLADTKRAAILIALP